MRRSALRRAARATALATTAALGAAGCGGEAGDLLALEVSGAFRSEPIRLTVTDDGRGACDRDALEPIPSDLLIEARAVERELEGLAEDGASFAGSDAEPTRDGRAPGGRPEGEEGAAGRRSYVARTRAGTVRWVEGAPRLPGVLPRTALLAQELEEGLCEG